MNYFLRLSFLFSMLTNIVFAQTMHSTVTKSKFSVQLDENTVVRNSEGKRVPYQTVAQMLSSKEYTLDPVRDTDGKITEYKIRAKIADDAGKREVTINKSSHLEHTELNRGEKFPEFALRDMDSNLVRSLDLKGKVLVINFWFSVCKPCLNEMQGLNALAEKYKNRKDVVLIAPTWEKENAIVSFLKSKSFGYVVCPEANELIKALKIIAYPTNVVVSKDGKIFSAYEGGLPGLEQTLEQDIEAVLKQ